jgi:hypothetical protein
MPIIENAPTPGSSSTHSTQEIKPQDIKGKIEEIKPNPEMTPEQRRRRGVKAMRARLTTEFEESKKPGDTRSEEFKKKLEVFNQISTYKEQWRKGNRFGLKYHEGDNIKPLPDDKIGEGDKQLSEKAYLSQINGVITKGEDKGKLECIFVDGENNFHSPIPLEDVVRMVVRTDEKTFKPEIPQDEQGLFKAYIGDRDGGFSEDLDPAIEKIAQAEETRAYFNKDEDEGFSVEGDEGAAENETELSPVEKVLQGRRIKIQEDLKAIEVKAIEDSIANDEDKKENPEYAKNKLKENPEYAKLKKLNATVLFAEAASGPLGAIVREETLRKIAKHNEKHDIEDASVKRLLREVENKEGFGIEVADAKKELGDILDDYDLTDDKERLKYEEAMRDPAKLYEIIGKGSEEIIEELSKGMFDNLNQSKADELFSDIMNSTNEAKRAELRKNLNILKQTGKWAGLLAAILAAAGVGAAAVTVASGLKAVSGRQ